MRMGLLGSTALIAAGLACTPAFAQTTIASPTGGGTITRPDGSTAPTVDNQTGAGGGIQISNVHADAGIGVNGVTINNTTGAPTSDALRILGAAGPLTTGVTLTGVNTLTTTTNGGSALYISTNANMGVAITSSGSTFTGSYGINLQAAAGYVSFNAPNQSQSFVANGTHIAGFNAVTGVNASIQLGASTFTGFDTGINTSNFYGSFVEMTGGSINALVTGIRADATGGRSNIQSQAAMVAPTGIHSTNTDGGDVTTSGAGTINSTVVGTGTGIIATSSGGTNNLNVTVGAAIGGTTRFGTGVNASATGGTGIVNVTTTAAINAGTGISLSSGSGATANVQGAITASTGISSTALGGGVTNITTSGAGTLNALSANNGTGISATTSGSGALNVTVGAAIGGSSAFGTGVLLTTTNPSTAVINFLNTAAITASTASSSNSGLQISMWNPSGRSTIDIGADITGGRGVYTSGGVYDFNIRSGATITAAAANGHGINSSNSGSILVNAGVIRATGAGGYGAYISGMASITNSGTIEGAARGISLVNTTTINNTGFITGGSGGGIEGTGATVYNTGGTISGNTGISANGNPTNITNSAGGVITGVVDGVNLSGIAFGTLTNSAAISADTAAGVYLSRTSGSTYQIVNTGTITGGSNATLGYGINLEDGATTITNNSGGQINGLSGLASGRAIRVISDDQATLNLNAGSTVNGGILSTGSGNRTISLGGAVTGAYDASGGTGVDSFTLTATGSIGGAVSLGDGNDTFNWNGGTIGSTINAGAGATDAFNSVLGIGGSGSLNLSNLSNFEAYNHLSGTLTLTGSNSGGYGWAGTSGAIVNNGSISATANALSFNNTGTGASGSSLTNAGSLEGLAAGFVMSGTGDFSVTNTGSINGSSVGTGLGVSQTAGTVTIANNSGGTISGNGYAVNTTGGSLALTSASGATLSGGSLGSVRAATSGTATIDLQAGSTTTGDMLLSGTGERTVTLAGLFSGNVDASGNSGAVNLTLNTSATGYTLLQGGSGADSLTFTGSGSRTFSVDNLTSWNTGAFTGGSWTLTGTGNQTSFVSGLTINGAALTISNTQQLQGATGLTMTGGGSITTTASMSNTRTINLTGAGGLGAASGMTLTQSGVISGAGALTLNGPGTVILSGTNTYTGGTVVNSGILRLNNTAAAGTGVIRMIDPQIDFAAGGTYSNAISLEVVDGQQAADPTILNKTAGGSITLAGRIYETPGVGGANQYVTFNGGDIYLTNNANSWGGVTTVNNNTVVFIQSGGVNGLSGGSIVNNGVLYYLNNTAGTVAQNISGSGGIQIGSTAPVTFGGNVTSTGAFSVLNGAAAVVAGARSGSTGTGVVVSGSSASLGVANGGSIVGGGQLGVHMSGVGSTLNNLGSITNSGTANAIGAAVYAQATSGTITINNGSASDTGAGSTIRGYNAGIRHDLSTGGLLVVNNYGLVLGDQYNGIENSTGALTVNNFAGGFITTGGNGNGIVSGSAGAVSITNAGTIGRNIAGDVTVSGYGVYANGVLTLANQTGGQIFGTTGGVQVNAAGSTITNAGAIRSGLTGGSVITSTAANMTLTNQAGGSLFGYYGVTTIGGTIDNTGLIRGFNDAILLNGATALTNNAGGLIVGQGNEGVFVNATGSTISNAGLIVNALNGIGANYSVAITNSGVIASGSATDAATTAAHISRLTGTAIALGAGGSVTNQSGGQILGGAGIAFNNAVSGTLTNAGLIDGSTGYGVTMTGAGTITNQSGGSIAGLSGAILLSGAGANTVSLSAGSTSGRIVSTSTGARTVTVAGDLTGDYSAGSATGVDTVTLASTGAMTGAFLGGGADSFTWQGGSFSGSIDGGSGTDGVITALGAGSGALDLDYLTNFETFIQQSGTVTLTGTGNFSGGALLTGGALIVDGTLQSFASVASGATLSGGGTVTSTVTVANGGILANTQGSTLTTGALTLSSGSIINATFSGAGGSALFAVDGALTLDGTVNVASTGAFGFGVYGLMTYTGALTDQGLLLGTTPALVQRMALQTSVAGQINIVHAPNELLFWDGGDAGLHDDGSVDGGAGVWTAAGSEWTDASGLANGVMTPQPGFAIFQGAGGVVTVDDVAGAVEVTGIQFASDGYQIEGDAIALTEAATIIRVGDGTAPGAAWTATIASALTGAGGLVKTDLGTLILAGGSDYTGGTTINAGTLQIGDGATAGSIAGAVVLANGSSVTFARADDHDFTNAVSGTGTVNVNGVATLSGAITATSGVGVSAGSTATLSDVRVVNGNAVFGGLDSVVNLVAGGTIQSQNGTGVFLTGADGEVNNAGSITASSNGVFSNGGLTLTNAATGTINAVFAVVAVQNLDLTNDGVIAATNTAFNSSGIYAGGTGAISNTGTITSGSNAIYTQGAGTLTNSGLIRGGGAASTVRLFGAGSSVTNLANGEITTTGTGAGLYLDGLGATVVNSGTIRGGNAVNFVSGGGALTNDGILVGTTASGVFGNGATTVDNLTGGSITGATNGVSVTGVGTLTNDGTITGTAGYGALLQAGGEITNTGSITGAQGGVRSLAALILTSSGGISGPLNAVESVGVFDDNLTFLAGSTTDGAVLTNGGDDLISLAGALNGVLDAGDGADTVTLVDTARFTATLDGGAGVDAFVLDGSGAGSLDIGQVLNFESRAMNGGGTWTLTGTDAATAAWSLNAGVLAVSGGSAINDAAFVDIAVGGTLSLLNDETIGALTGSGFVDLGGGGLTLAGAETTTYDGVISGAGGLTIGSAYDLSLTGANTATGLTAVDGILRLGASGVLADGSSLLINAGGVVELQGFDETVDNAYINGVLNGPGTLTAGVYALDGAALYADLGAGLLFNVGGVSTLTGASNADLVVVDGGTLRLGASDRIVDTADLQVAVGATFDLGAFSETVNVTSINGTLAGTGTLTALQHQLDGATVNADIAGGSAYVVGGASTLNGASYADLLSVISGSLTLGAADRIADTATLAVSSGATLNLGAFDETVDIAALAGTLNGTGTLTAVEYQLDGAIVNANLGGGDLLNFSGVSTLNGTSDAANLLVLGGALSLGASDRLADTGTIVVFPGATLDMGAFDDTVDFAVLIGALAGTGTLTANQYALGDAIIDANLGVGILFHVGGVSTLNGTSAADVVVQDGTLTLGASNRLADTAYVWVDPGATLDLGAFDETVELAVLDGTLAGTGTLTADEYDLYDATIDANLGAGSLFNAGGVSTLNGTSAAAFVSVQAGVLTLGASERLADAATVSVESGATLDLGAFNETVDVALLSGALTGTGTLTAAQYALDGGTIDANLGAGSLFNTGGVSTLTGTSAADDVSVLAGTLAFGASNRLADTATVSVASGSTLNLGAFNDTVDIAALNGVLAGTGTLTAAQYQLNAAVLNANLGAGTLFNLGGVSALNGTAAASYVFINAGALRLGAAERLSDAATVSVASGGTFDLNGFNERIDALYGTGDVDVGAGRLTIGGEESAFGGRLSGTGSVVHAGSLFTLLGDHSIRSISNTAGELRFAGTTTGSISASGGSVTGAGTIGGALTASNGAVLSPGLAGVQNGIGGFTAGGLTLNGATLAIDVLGMSGGNLVDQLRINGAATLTGGVLAPTFHGPTSDFDFATRYLFLQANNLVGTFANGSTFTATAQDGLFWRVRYDLAPNAAVLELRLLANLDPGATGTGNQRAIGQALSGGQLGASDDWASVIGLIAGLSAADRAAAFDSISGEPLADVTTSMFSASETFQNAVRNGGLGGRNDGGEALNFVDSLSFSGGRENSADRLGDVLGAFDPSAPTGRGAGGWVSAYAGDQTLDGKPGQATVESKLNGFAGGYGVRHGSMSLGGAAGVTRLEGDVAARDGHYESDLSHAAGYVAFDDGVWAADVTASFYGGDLDTRRGIAIGAFRGMAIGNTHAEGQALSASVARRFQVSDDGMIAVGVIGTASNASVDGYTETGAGALSLQASGQERDWQSLQFSARATQDYRVNGRGFRVYGGAGIMAMAGDRQATGDMRFTGAPVGFGSFVVEGAEAPPVAGLADFGVEVGAGEGVTVSAGYRGLFSERLQDNQVGIKLNVSW